MAVGSCDGRPESGDLWAAAAPRRAVLLFARSPAAEAATKRLRRGAGLFALTLRRVQAAAAEADAELVVVGDGWWLRPPGVRCLPQRGRGFGQRLANAFADVRALGFDRVVSAGIDSPGIRGRHFAAAFAALDRAPMALGPADDGGTYLIGCSGEAEGVLREVRWLRPTVLGELRARCPDAVVLVETLTDVDHGDDLWRLLRTAPADAEVAALVAATSGPVAPGSHPAPRRRHLHPREPFCRRGPPALAA